MSAPKPTRRDFVRTSLSGSVAVLLGFERLESVPLSDQERDPFQSGKQLSLVEFTGESSAPLNTIIGTGLDARLYSDLSRRNPEHLITPTENFYIRTSASPLLATSKPWTIQIGGAVEQPATLNLDELKKTAKPMGLHLMECSGNRRDTRFALLSVADWKGVLLSDLLAANAKPRTDRVMVSGFDQYPAQSVTSVAGADWIFTLDQLKSAKAFLATEMNGQPLTRDHGAPVRLVMPGWYGCTCIKWVNALTFVGEETEATTQMQEFAARTHQQGIPKLAREYQPAIIDQAAMPIRVEKWLVSGKIRYRVAGILWGGSRLINRLQIRFNPEEDYVPVQSFSQKVNDPWSFWSHLWTPKAPGTYLIRLRVIDPGVTTRRLDAGHYVRSVEITEI